MSQMDNLKNTTYIPYTEQLGTAITITSGHPNNYDVSAMYRTNVH